ncbi:MAG: hypothetical protein NT157_04340 [Candidatus Micrarchaeota archaeon]|nr:hypothetical protein [Candidatus Micrarchaeota archaeon]
MGTLHETLDHAFRGTCKAVFGREIGGIEEWGGWLSEYAKKPAERKSYLSGRSVHPASRNYPREARFIHFDEIDFNKKFEPLNINEIKDVDSIVDALGERACYSGSVVLGNSKEVEDSANVTDSFFVYDCNAIWKCKYAAHSSYCKDGAYLFGTHDTAACEHILRCINVGGPKGLKRGFESLLISNSTDMYYSFYMQGCTDCMFSFFQKGKRHAIGNLELEKEKYAAIKRKLIDEVVGELLSKKKTLRFIDLFKKEREEPAEGGWGFDRAEMDRAFNDTTRVVLGRELGDVDAFGKWLTDGLDFYDLTFVKSAVSGKPVPVIKEYWGFTSEIRQISLEELEAAAKTGIPVSEGTSIRELREKLSRVIGYCTIFEENCEKTDCPVICVNTWNARKCIMPVLSKNVAYCFWPRESENIFGSSVVFNSSFVIRSMHCSNITRAFEVDSSSDSADIYFSHNVENARDCMFCFNAKNLAHAIGNAQLQPENFRKIKSSLLEQVASELERKKSLKWSIYNIGERRK